MRKAGHAMRADRLFFRRLKRSQLHRGSRGLLGFLLGGFLLGSFLLSGFLLRGLLSYFLLGGFLLGSFLLGGFLLRGLLRYFLLGSFLLGWHAGFLLRYTYGQRLVREQ